MNVRAVVWSVLFGVIIGLIWHAVHEFWCPQFPFWIGRVVCILATAGLCIYLSLRDAEREAAEDSAPQ